jgi:hypothetical protein
MAMKFGLVVFVLLASTVLGLVGVRLSPEFAWAVPFLLPLVGLAALAWLAYDRGRHGT